MRLSSPSLTNLQHWYRYVARPPLPPKELSSTTATSTTLASSSTTSPAAPPRTFKRLTLMRRGSDVVWDCATTTTSSSPEATSAKHLCDITLVNDVDLDLMMMIGTQSSGVRGWCTKLLAGVVLGQGMHILVNTSATHNILNINFTQLASLMERRINMIFVGSGNEIACRGACFNVRYASTLRRSRSTPFWWTSASTSPSSSARHE